MLAAAAIVKGWTGRLGEALAREPERHILWAPVALAFGIGLYFLPARQPPEGLGYLALILALGLAWLAWQRRYEDALGPRRVLAALALIALGFSIAQIRTNAVAAQRLPSEIGPVMISGEVAEFLPHGRAIRLILAEPKWRGQNVAPAYVRISVRRAEADIFPGDRVEVLAVIAPPGQPDSPGGYHFARTAWFDRLGGSGYAVGPVRRLDQGVGVDADVARLLAGWRQALTERILAALPGTQGAVAAALMTGVRGAIPDAVQDDLRDSGLTHLLSISGLHMTMVAGLAFAAVRRGLALVPVIAQSLPTKKIGAVAALAIITLYVLISGGSPPAERSYLMLTIVLLAVLADRRALSLRTIALAGFGLLLVWPEALADPSFQMSFAAVAGLSAWAENHAERRQQDPDGQESADPPGWQSLIHATGGLLWALVLTSLVATLATEPIAAAHFNRITILGVLANLVAIPVAEIAVMPFGLLAVLLMPFGLESLALTPMGWGISAVLAIAGFVASLPGAAIGVVAPPMLAMVLFVLGGLWLIIWRGPLGRAGLLALPPALLLWALAQPPDLLIDGEGRVFALRREDGALVLPSGLRTGKALAWDRGNAGEGRIAARAPNSGLTCDALGCVGVVKGRQIAYGRVAEATSEDCGRADILISPVVIPSCPTAILVIDQRQLRRHGAHALTLDASGSITRIWRAVPIPGGWPWQPIAPRETNPAPETQRAPPVKAAPDDDGREGEGISDSGAEDRPASPEF